jgi:cofilin
MVSRSLPFVSVLQLTDLSLSLGKCWPRCHDNDAQTLIRLRLSVNPDCVSAFNDLKLKAGRGGPKYIIYKISDDQKEIVVDEIGSETDYDVFREKLVAKKEGTGKDRPSYAIYDVEFELEGGEGKRFDIARQ